MVRTFKCDACGKWRSTKLLWTTSIDDLRYCRYCMTPVNPRRAIMDGTVYILGTSPDLLKIPRGWFKDKNTIGINSAYRIAAKHGIQLTDWIAHDQLFAFYDWLHANDMPLTRKWCLWDYCIDDRLLIFHPSNKLYQGYKDHNVHYYRTQRIPRRLQPHVTTSVDYDKDGMTCLDDYIYTIFTAISLAVGLGYKRIRLRGVSFSGHHFDEKEHTFLDGIYGDQMMIFKNQVLPALKELHIDISNDTEDAAYYFDDYKVIAKK